jgi:hypothetical protein
MQQTNIFDLMFHPLSDKAKAECLHYAMHKQLGASHPSPNTKQPTPTDAPAKKRGRPSIKLATAPTVSKPSTGEKRGRKPDGNGTSARILDLLSKNENTSITTMISEICEDPSDNRQSQNLRTLVGSLKKSGRIVSTGRGIYSIAKKLNGSSNGVSNGHDTKPDFVEAESPAL